MVAASVENLILSIILGKVMGMAGIFLASAISRLTTYFWYEPKLLYHTFFDMKVKGYYVHIIVNAIATLISCGIISIILHRIIVGGWLGWVFKAFISVSISSIIAIVLYKKTTGFNWLQNKIIMVFRKNRS